MREPAYDAKPGQEMEASLTWQSDGGIRPGARVEATDGALGVVRERRLSEDGERAFLGVEGPGGVVWVPEQLVRETNGDTVLLSLPAADVRAQSPDRVPSGRGSA